MSGGLHTRDNWKLASPLGLGACLTVDTLYDRMSVNAFSVLCTPVLDHVPLPFGSRGFLLPVHVPDFEVPIRYSAPSKFGGLAEGVRPRQERERAVLAGERK